MKIAHISDIHWRGIARHEEYVAAFEKLFDLLRTRVQPDLIINTGDTFHTKTHGITPEVIEKLTWMLRELANIAPTIHILGNHDGNLTNSSRQDVISPIHEAINHPRSYLFKNSTTESISKILSLPVGKEAKEFLLHVYSPFDTDGWKRLQPKSGAINLALFHGSVLGSVTDGDHKLHEAEADLRFFEGMDFALLGDIHRQQFMAHRPDCNGVQKPWIAYPGSLIQQNFGESLVKGFLTWDIRDQDDWDCKFVEVENLAPFLTVPWAGTVTDTLLKANECSPSGSLVKGSRVRISSSEQIQQLESRQLLQELKTHRGVSEVVFKYDLVSRMESIDASGRKVLKTDLRHDYEATSNFYRSYIEAHKDSFSLNQSQLSQAESLIRGYLDRFNSDEIEQQTVPGTEWSVKSLTFDNILRYGENNAIDFQALNGIVGIFGPNKTGKSSAVGALMYGLFNSTDRGNLKGSHIINRNKKHCNARILFSSGGTDYEVFRETARNIPKKNPKKEDLEKTVTALSLHRILSDGTRQEMNSISKEDTDKEIRKLIGSSQDFLMTALSNQGGVGRFIDEGATQRKAILSKFLDLDIFEKLFSYAKEDFSVINDKTKKYNQYDWSETLGRLSSEIKALEARTETVKEQIQEALKKKDELKHWIMQHETDMEEVSTAKLSRMKASFSALEKRMVGLLRQEEKLKVSIKDLEDQSLELLSQTKADELNRLTDKLQEVEKSKTLLSMRKQELEAGQVLLAQQTRSVKKLQQVPCGDSFPTCQFIKDSHADKEKIGQQSLLVRNLEEAYERDSSVFQGLLNEKIAEKLVSIRDAEKKLASLTNRVHTDKTSLLTTSRDISDLRKEMVSLEKDIFLMEKKLSSSKSRELEKNRMLLEVLTDDHVSLENRYREFLVQLGANTEKYQRIMKEKSECRTDLELLKVHDSIQNAFSKNGIPAMVLKTQLPAINFELSKILDGFVDFKISLETDITSNVMDVYIEDTHSRRIIELASGMEKMISSLALRVALINLSSLPRSDMFIVDEGWGSLDSENLQKVSAFLSGLRAYFKTILVISHIQEIKEAADEIIEIRNDGFESYISYPPNKVEF